MMAQLETTIQVNDFLKLTPILDSDRDRCVVLLNDREIYKNTLRIPSPYLPEDFDKFMGFVKLAADKIAQPAHFAIRDGQDRLIGVLGFDDLAPGHSAEVGYWLGEEARGKGVMTTVIQAACAFAQREWDLVRICAKVFDGNSASVRVLEKSNFQFEGKLRKACKKDEQFIDLLLFALIREQ